MKLQPRFSFLVLLVSIAFVNTESFADDSLKVGAAVENITPDPLLPV